MIDLIKIEAETDSPRGILKTLENKRQKTLSKYKYTQESAQPSIISVNVSQRHPPSCLS
jgi:hypothetical protein